MLKLFVSLSLMCLFCHVRLRRCMTSWGSGWRITSLRLWLTLWGSSMEVSQPRESLPLRSHRNIVFFVYFYFFPPIQALWLVLPVKSWRARKTLTVSWWAERLSSQSSLKSSTPRHKNPAGCSESVSRSDGLPHSDDPLQSSLNLGT